MGAALVGRCPECLSRYGDEPAAGTGSSPRAGEGAVTRAALGQHLVIANNSGRHPGERYDVARQPTGVGGFGTVKLATDRRSGEVCALKTVRKGAIGVDALCNEVEISLIMDHPNIVRLFDVYEDRYYAYLALEICHGGELLDLIIAAERFGEGDAAIVMSQLLRAVNYMHALGIAHRDLKLENLLLKDKGLPIQQNTLKLIDFGLSERFTPGTISLKGIVGSCSYIAPEVLTGKAYSEACDLWSCGVILYMLVGGVPPFSGQDQEAILKSVKSHALWFDPIIWEPVSAEAQALIKNLCQRNVQRRLPAMQALSDPWLTQPRPTTSAQPEEGSRIPKVYFEKLRAFSSLDRFKRSAVRLIAHRLDDSYIQELTRVFQELDENQDGTLSLQEVTEGFKKTGSADMAAHMAEIFESVDTNHNDRVDYTEFIAATVEQSLYHKEELCWEAFRVFDTDCDGVISVEELGAALRMKDSPVAELGGQIDEILAQVDANGDGQVDFTEFVAMLRQQT
mmetsp:Transcript_127018/g.270864  ORF Transcript_127018/g.270864 Transcript_127018/m.270864 type:complete len:510 (+) Transcript_127018:66-1595(+)